MVIVNNSLKKYALDKVVLLGIFVFGLLVAWFIVAWRSRVVLSEPVELNYAGLSVSIPKGNGWQSRAAWRYQDDSFILSSLLGADPDRATAWLWCRYLLASSRSSSQEQFGQKADKFSGHITQVGRIQAGAVIINWVHISAVSKRLHIFFGTTELPYGRTIDIEVHQLGGADLAQRVFKSVAHSVKFTDNLLLAGASRIVEAVKDKGLDYYIRPENKKNFFLVKDSEMKVVGFSADMVAVSGGDEAERIIRVADFSYVHSRWGYSGRHSVFESDARFGRFAWKSDTTGPAGLLSRSVRITLAEDGIINVTRAGSLLEKKYVPSVPAAPAIIIEPIIIEFLDSGGEQIILDIIFSSGKIVPTLLSKIEAPQSAYAVRLDFLDRKNSYEQIYFGYDKEIHKRVVQNRQLLTLERSTKDRILGEFPSLGDYILQMDELLQQGLGRTGKD